MAQKHISADRAIAFTGSFAAPWLPERLGAARGEGHGVGGGGGTGPHAAAGSSSGEDLGGASTESRDRQQIRYTDSKQCLFQINQGSLTRLRGTSCRLRAGRVRKVSGGCIFGWRLLQRDAWSSHHLDSQNVNCPSKGMFKRKCNATLPSCIYARVYLY